MMNTLATEISMETHDEPDSGDIQKLHFRNDIGYADAFAEEVTDRARFIAEEGEWIIFDSVKGWHRDTSGEIKNLQVSFAKAQYQKALDEAALLDPKEASSRINEAARLGDKKRLSPALEYAAVNPKLVVHVSELDREPHLLGTQNGVVDLRDGSFSPHSPSILVTRSCSCSFIADADCPTFKVFLAQVQPDLEMQGYLQRLCGYTLTGWLGEHILPFHYGVGANGKGTFLEQTLFKILGSYAAKLTDSLVYVDKRGATPYLEIAGLCGIRFALGEENEDGGSLNERLLKSIPGGDRQKGRFHYKPFFEYDPTAKVHLVGNHRPRIQGRDDGIWRRFRLIDWGVKIAEADRDLRLQEKLAPEFPGILNWMIAGALMLGDSGTLSPQSVIMATEKFREDSDSFGDFLKEKTVDDPEGKISKAELFEVYKLYCNDQEIQQRWRIVLRVFNKRIEERGYGEGVLDGGKTRIWRGIRARRASDE